MTARAIRQVIAEVLADLSLGSGSVRTSSWYRDYASLEFALFHTPAIEEDIRRRFRRLCLDHGWAVCNVSANRDNSVCITLQESHIIAANDGRMP